MHPFLRMCFNSWFFNMKGQMHKGLSCDLCIQSILTSTWLNTFLETSFQIMVLMFFPAGLKIEIKPKDTDNLLRNVPRLFSLSFSAVQDGTHYTKMDATKWAGMTLTGLNLPGKDRVAMFMTRGVCWLNLTWIGYAPTHLFLLRGKCISLKACRARSHSEKISK